MNVVGDLIIPFSVLASTFLISTLSLMEGSVHVTLTWAPPLLTNVSEVGQLLTTGGDLSVWKYGNR